MLEVVLCHCKHRAKGVINSGRYRQENGDDFWKAVLSRSVQLVSVFMLIGRFSRRISDEEHVYGCHQVAVVPPAESRQQGLPRLAVRRQPIAGRSDQVRFLDMQSHLFVGDLYSVYSFTLMNCGRGLCFSISTRLRVVVGGKRGHAPCRILSLFQVIYHVSQSSWKLSQS